MDEDGGGAPRHGVMRLLQHLKAWGIQPGGEGYHDRAFLQQFSLRRQLFHQVVLETGRVCENHVAIRPVYLRDGTFQELRRLFLQERTRSERAMVDRGPQVPRTTGPAPCQGIGG